MMTNTIPSRLLLALCAVVLGGCGYASSPGLVVETKEFNLSDNSQLIVTRHLDDWRTGNPFRFEWYVVECKIGSDRPFRLLEDFNLRGTFSSEIPEKRVQVGGGQIGYAYFSELVVFDKKCNRLSHFAPWRTSIAMIEPGKITNPMRIEGAHVGQNGQGYANLSWANRSGGTSELTLRTDDYGVFWILPTDTAYPNNSVRLVLPSIASFSNSETITKKLETSEYVITGGALVQRPEVVSTNPSTSLGKKIEFEILKKAIEIARDRISIGNWTGVIFTENKNDYEVTIGNSPLDKYPYYPYSTKVLISKQSNVLTKWLSDSQLP